MKLIEFSKYISIYFSLRTLFRNLFPNYSSILCDSNSIFLPIESISVFSSVWEFQPESCVSQTHVVPLFWWPIRFEELGDRRKVGKIFSQAPYESQRRCPSGGKKDAESQRGRIKTTVLWCPTITFERKFTRRCRR